MPSPIYQRLSPDQPVEAEVIAENPVLIILRAAMVPFVGWRTHGLY
ncbi:hypothetical protein Vi05172_g3508 [Venturia inaequalis]|nr:hypothetical protein Vi05172_g3508 [Venturia inaequalis]